MATINPSQDYDIVHTLTYASSGGTAPICLFRGSDTPITGTVYYRAGTSGSWTSLSVSGYDTTFPITSTTMQIAHNWNKSGNYYMTPSFWNGTMTGIAISQKAVLSGIMGDFFMYQYAYACINLTTLDVPDTSGLTSVGDWFMISYAYSCSSLTSLEVPDTSGLTSAGFNFMYYYAYNCFDLVKLILPKAGWFKTNNVDWSVPSGRLGLLHGDTTNSIDQADWQALTVSDETLYTNYIHDSFAVWLNGVPPNAPTTTLNSPANNVSLTTTTPTLEFTATDPDGEDVSYQIQVGNADFSTLHMDATTTTYASGTQQTKVVSPALTQGGIDYYWRVRAKDPSGTDTYGAWATARKMTTEILPPSVTSGATTAITTTTATAAGEVTAANGATITERGIAYHTSTDPTTANSKQVVAGTTGSFDGNLTGLTPNTTYYWRAYATNSKGTTYGVNRNFTTEPRPPTATTGISGGTSANQFTVSGSAVATNLDSQTIDEFGIVYSTSENPTISDSKQVGTGTSVSWSNNVTSLPDSTTYYIRAYVKWRGTDYAYGPQVTLTTPDPPAPPTITTSAATNIIDTRVDITSTVTTAGDGTVTERGVVFGLSEDPTTDDGKVTAITGGTGEYSLRITGLEPETEYYYRAYAVNEHGTGYSTQKSFTTLPPFVPDEGDGYWAFSATGSDAIVARSQATPADSSVSLPLADLGLEDGKTYTLAVGDFVSELGDLGISLLYYDDASPVTTNVPENSQLTFTYNLTDYHTYILQLHVTGDDPVAEELTATFKDLYLAEESTFSDFVPFTPYGLFEIKLENNQIVDKRRQDVIQSMYNQLEGWEITPFEVTTEGLGYFEIGDGITIKDPQDNEAKSYLTEYTLTLDGGITEKLIAKRPAESQTDYSKAGNIKKLISNTTLQVDKQNQTIEALVADVYDNDGYIEEKFTQVEQDINQVRTTVQGAGGVNLIRNSVMYAYNNLGYPEEWTTTHVDGEGSTIFIQGSAESKAAGGLSGHIFTLTGTKVVQTVTVRKDADFIAEENKTFYTFNIKVKKDLVGEAYVKLSNRQEEHIIELPNGEDYLWEDFSIDGLLPQDDHYDIEIYSDSDANAQFTDAMLSVGEYTHSWTQAPGEAMNMVRSDTVDGTYWRSPQFRYNYTHISPLGMNVHQRIRGQEEEVFGFNADETNMSKVKATKQVSMGKIRVVPIEMSGTSGWAWTGVDE